MTDIVGQVHDMIAVPLSTHKAMLAERDATITTLRAEVEDYKRKEINRPYLVKAEDAQAWIEGLGDVLGELKDQQIATLRAEIERLRALLKEVDDWVRDLEPFADAGHEPVTVFKKVRAALTQEKPND